MSQKYEAIPQAESAWISPVAASGTQLEKQQGIWTRWAINFWVTATVFFALFSAFLGSQLYRARCTGSFSQGFQHELEAAKHLIRVEERLFQGSPRFLEDGTEYVPDPTDGKPRTQYVGDPSGEIDKARDRLHQGG